MAAIQQWQLGLMRKRTIPVAENLPRWYYLETFTGSGSLASHAPDQAYHGASEFYTDPGNGVMSGGSLVHNDPTVPRFSSFWAMDGTQVLDRSQEIRFEVDFTPIAEIFETIPGDGPGLPAFPTVSPTFYAATGDTGALIVVEYNPEAPSLRMLLLRQGSEGSENIETFVYPEDPAWGTSFRVIISFTGNDWYKSVNEVIVAEGTSAEGFPPQRYDSVVTGCDSMQIGGTHMDGPPLQTDSGSCSRIGLWAATAPPTVYVPLEWVAEDGEFTSTPGPGSYFEDAMNWDGSRWRVDTDNSFGSIYYGLSGDSAGFPGSGLEIEMVHDFLDAPFQTRTDLRMQSVIGEGWAINIDWNYGTSQFQVGIGQWVDGGGATPLAHSATLTGVHTIMGRITADTLTLFIDGVEVASTSNSVPVNFAGGIVSVDMHGSRYGTPFPSEDTRIISARITPLA